MTAYLDLVGAIINKSLIFDLTDMAVEPKYERMGEALPPVDIEKEGDYLFGKAAPEQIKEFLERVYDSYSPLLDLFWYSL